MLNPLCSRVLHLLPLYTCLSWQSVASVWVAFELLKVLSLTVTILLVSMRLIGQLETQDLNISFIEVGVFGLARCVSVPEVWYSLCAVYTQSLPNSRLFPRHTFYSVSSDPYFHSPHLPLSGQDCLIRQYHPALLCL